MNAKVGSQETPGATGKFSLGTRNEAGQTNIVLPRKCTGHSFSFEKQASFNFMSTITVHNDFHLLIFLIYYYYLLYNIVLDSPYINMYP